MFLFSWIWRREVVDVNAEADKAVIVEKKKLVDEASERLNGAVIEVDAMNEMFDDTIRAVGRGRRK